MALPAEDVPFEGDEVIQDYIERFSNWGRWGDDDQLGALNHVGPEQVVAAAALVRQGKVISMGLPLDLNGPQSGGFRANPLNMMTATGTDYLAGKQDPLPGGFGPSKGFGFSDDVLVTPNQSGSQWDGLAHIFWKGKMYNGFDAGNVTAKGAATCGIEVMKSTFVMRGVLLDVARFRGVDCLAPGYAITAQELPQAPPPGSSPHGIERRSDRASQWAETAMKPLEPRHAIERSVPTEQLVSSEAREHDLHGVPPRHPAHAPGIEAVYARLIHRRHVTGDFRAALRRGHPPFGVARSEMIRCTAGD